MRRVAPRAVRTAHSRWSRAATVLGASVAIGILASGLLAGPASAAGTGYGPGTGQSTPPGGFINTVTSQTVQPSGGTVSATYDGDKLNLAIPAGDFSTPVEVTITAPTLSQISGAVAAFEVTFTVNGKPVTGTFGTPVAFTITSSSIKTGDVVDIWNGSSWVAYPDSSVTTGSAKITITSDPTFAVETASTSTVAAATTATTGIPVLGLAAISFGLVAVGIGGIFAVRRRRRPIRS